MNFLAHAWLSGENDLVLVANVTGDAFKGAIPTDLPADFRAGLQLHRFIDRQTDTHVELKQAAAQLKPFYGRYSGVALDIWLDHILARDFKQHHKAELGTFAQTVYKHMRTHEQWLNYEAKHIARFMMEHDWLTGYASREYILDVLLRMATRFKAPGLVEGGHPDEKIISDITLIFNNIKAELQVKTNAKIHDLLNG